MNSGKRTLLTDFIDTASSPPLRPSSCSTPCSQAPWSVLRVRGRSGVFPCRFTTRCHNLTNCYSALPPDVSVHPADVSAATTATIAPPPSSTAVLRSPTAIHLADTSAATVATADPMTSAPPSYGPDPTSAGGGGGGASCGCGAPISGHSLGRAWCETKGLGDSIIRHIRFANSVTHSLVPPQLPS